MVRERLETQPVLSRALLPLRDAAGRSSGQI